MNRIARRSMLKGVIATAALPATATVAAVSSPTKAAPVLGSQVPALDATLGRLGAVFLEQERALSVASVRLEEAAQRARAEWPIIPSDLRVYRTWPTGAGSECPVTRGYGYEKGERQSYSLLDHGDLQWHLDKAMEGRPRTEKSRAEKVALVEHWTREVRRLDEFEAQCEVVRQRWNIPALAAERDAAKAALKKTVEQIFLSPAETIAGLRVKARVIESAEARAADIVTSQFKMPGSLARDIAWIAAAGA